MSIKHQLYNPTEPFGAISLNKKSTKLSYVIALYTLSPSRKTHAPLLKTLPPYFHLSVVPKMAEGQMKSVASLLLLLNFCMYVIILGIGGWAMNRAINHGFIIGN